MGFQRLALFERQVVGLGEVDGRVGLRQGAGLVDDHGVDAAYAFQGGGVLDEDIAVGGLAYAHHQGGGGSQTESTGAGDDEYRDSRHDGMGQTGVASHSPPDEEGEQGDERHDGYEDHGDAVYGALNGSLAALRLFYHAYDLGQGGVVARLLGPQAQVPLAHHRTREHHRPFLFLGG